MLELLSAHSEFCVLESFVDHISLFDVGTDDRERVLGHYGGVCSGWRKIKRESSEAVADEMPKRSGTHGAKYGKAAVVLCIIM